MAGPWFTVVKSGDDWQQLDTIWISDGKNDCRGRIEVRLELEKKNESI